MNQPASSSGFEIKARGGKEWLQQQMDLEPSLLRKFYRSRANPTDKGAVCSCGMLVISLDLERVGTNVNANRKFALWRNHSRTESGTFCHVVCVAVLVFSLWPPWPPKVHKANPDEPIRLAPSKKASFLSG